MAALDRVEASATPADMLVAALSRYWPFANGSGRILDHFARDIDLGHGERVAITSDGFPMTVFAEDLIGRHIIMSGKFDRSVVQVLLDHARSGDVLLDIGANIGYVTACFLAHVAGSQAISVEPQPGVVDLLRHNLAQFGDRAKVLPYALSDKAGELRFHVDRDNRGASRIADDGETVVPAIDAAVLLSSLEKIDLIKIDVEGHEPTICKAMQKDLKRLQARAILFEAHNLECAQDIATLLEGYTVYGVAKKLLSTELMPIDRARGCNDYIATRN